MTKKLAPKCPNCNKKCSISGTPRVGSDLNYWTCFDCGYRVEEIEYIEQIQCIKCKEHFDKQAIEKHLEDWGGDAVYLNVCKSCYSDYDAFCDFIEDNHLGSYY